MGSEMCIRDRSHRLWSSVRAVSSSRRRSATSQSKMPPQQVERIPDLARHAFDLSTHDIKSLPVQGRQNVKHDSDYPVTGCGRVHAEKRASPASRGYHGQIRPSTTRAFLHGAPQIGRRCPKLRMVSRSRRIFFPEGRCHWTLLRPPEPVPRRPHNLPVLGRGQKASSPLSSMHPS